MKNYLTQNAKMKMSSQKIFNFGIPAYKAADGFKTCPFAGSCANGCYAQMGTYVWTPVKNAYENRLALTKDENFALIMITEILRRKIMYVRIHDSGDFYSKAYLKEWLVIINSLPEVTFYAYTKALPFFKEITLPENFVVIYSFGGKLDSEINVETDRHSKVFFSIEELKKAGYADASHDDSVAFDKNNHKIGLIYHGYKKGEQAWKN